MITGRDPGHGYIVTLAAIRRLAEALFPENWKKDRVPEHELVVWNALGVTLDGAQWTDHLRVLVKPYPELLINRICDYAEAHRQFRNLLLAGEIKAYHNEDNGDVQEIIAKHWRILGNENVLLEGSTWIEEENSFVCRLIMISESDVEKVVASFSPEKIVQTANKGGRRPTHDPAHVRSIVFRLMELNGEFSTAVEVWNAQARLEAAVRVE